jgi:hypothetical protein
MGKSGCQWPAPQRAHSNTLPSEVLNAFVSFRSMSEHADAVNHNADILLHKDSSSFSEHCRNLKKNMSSSHIHHIHLRRQYAKPLTSKGGTINEHEEICIVLLESNIYPELEQPYSFARSNAQTPFSASQ